MKKAIEMLTLFAGIQEYNAPFWAEANDLTQSDYCRYLARTCRESIAVLEQLHRESAPKAVRPEPSGLVLTEADAIADLNGGPRPDASSKTANATAKAGMEYARRLLKEHIEYAEYQANQGNEDAGKYEREAEGIRFVLSILDDRT